MTSSSNPWAVETWSQAKSSNPDLNEDIAVWSAMAIVLADGATDKNGVVYPSGKTGGKSLAETAAAVALDSSLVGYELADAVTETVRTFYRHNNPSALTDSSQRAATTLAVVRLLRDQLVVTQIADTNIRLNMVDGSRHILTNDKLVDSENADVRAAHIMQTLIDFKRKNGREPDETEQQSIVANGRAVIQDRLSTQHRLQNSTQDVERGYGFIDGTQIPRVFANSEKTNYVRTFQFPIAQVASVELVSDGFYGVFPNDVSIAAYQALYRQIHEKDPYKYLEYRSTKSRDDATVIIATLAK